MRSDSLTSATIISPVALIRPYQAYALQMRRYNYKWYYRCKAVRNHARVNGTEGRDDDEIRRGYHWKEKLP
jgi:hypothetical protein